MEMFQKLIKRTSVMLVFLLTGLLIVNLVAIIVIFFLRSDEAEETDRKEIYKYRKRIINQETNQSTYGIVSFPHKLENDFLSYTDEVGNEILMSKFGDEEYECTGSCYCEEFSDDFGDEERRGGIIASNLRYILAAASLPLAYKISDHILQRKCREKPAKTWKEVIDRCDKIKSQTDHCARTGINEDEPYRLTDVKYDKRKTRAWCTGNCLVNRNWLDSESQHAMSKSNFKYGLETGDYEEVVEKCSEIVSMLMVIHWKDDKRTVEQIFEQQGLGPICERYSRMVLVAHRRGESERKLFKNMELEDDVILEAEQMVQDNRFQGLPSDWWKICVSSQEKWDDNKTIQCTPVEVKDTPMIV